MRMKAHVIGVQSHGDQLAIEAQGESAGDAAWRPMNSIKFSVADIPKNQRAFYVGRQFVMTIEPR